MLAKGDKKGHLKDLGKIKDSFVLGQKKKVKINNKQINK